MLSSSDVVFDSDDLNETEDFLVRNYARMSIGARGERPSTRIRRRWLGEINFDKAEFSYDMSYDSEPLDKVCLCRIREGHIEDQIFGQPTDVLSPGDIALISPPHLPFSGGVRAAVYDLVMFDPELLARVASPASGRPGDPIRLLSHRPTSPQGARQLAATMDFFEEVANGREATPLVASAAAMLLASVIVSNLPTNAVMEPDTSARTAQPALLRKAVAYIEANAQDEITLSDIAATVHITPRTLQYMFRRHLDASPMEYLRRVRLDHAHRELTSADPTTTTVNAVAHRWGFIHTGRFSALYRRTYGRTPSATLRS
nr:AraC family transcriptional regulator [Mycolicibacterium malmesburyense]CRL76084.1 AraC family transcriptional regulator [Mycolicibacterium malmesburyense]